MPHPLTLAFLLRDGLWLHFIGPQPQPILPILPISLCIYLRLAATERKLNVCQRAVHCGDRLCLCKDEALLYACAELRCSSRDRKTYRSQVYSGVQQLRMAYLKGPLSFFLQLVLLLRDAPGYISEASGVQSGPKQYTAGRCWIP